MDILGLGGVLLQLAADIGHIDPQDLVAAAAAVRPPDVLQDEVVGEHLPGVDGQQLDDLELVLGEVDLLPRQEHLVPGQVDGQVFDLIDVPLDPLAQLQPLGPAQGGADPGQQLRHAEGLDHIVVRSHVQSPDLLRLPVPGGDDDHRDLPGQVPELGQDLQTVYVREPQVQQHQVGAVGEEEGQALSAGIGRDGPVVIGGQGPADEIADGPLVLDDEDGMFFDHSAISPCRQIKAAVSGGPFSGSRSRWAWTGLRAGPPPWAGRSAPRRPPPGG